MEIEQHFTALYIEMLYLAISSAGTVASIVDTKGTGKLQANPPVADPRLSPGMPTQRAVTTMGSIELVVGEEHLLRLGCLLHN